MHTEIKRNRIMEKGFFVALGKIEVTRDIAIKLYNDTKELLTTILSYYGDGINLEHEMGIPHTAVDFNDNDENDIPKQKNIIALMFDENEKKLKAYFDDNTSSTDFGFDDITYLLDEVIEFFDYEADVN